jgi:hypothetical protein
MSGEPDIEMILAKDSGGTFRLYACRGAGRGCPRNEYRTAKKPCEDCVLAIESETLGELQERLAKGDA